MNVSRRTLLRGGLAVAGGGLFAACSGNTTGSGIVVPTPTPTPLKPRSGRSVVTKTLTARPTTLDLGGPTVSTWAYDDVLPGPLVRATAGDLVRITVDNQLPVETSVHWHGIALQNAADGVPGLTQKAVASRQQFTYEFIAPDPGTYFYHPHVGVQLDRGLYAPLIIDDPHEPGAYDAEWIVVLDDWIDGTGTTPDEVLAELMAGQSSGGMHMGGMDGMAGMGGGSPFGDAGDVTYPHFLINGRVGSAPDVLRAKPGQRVRIRVINAAADTIFAVALGDHRMTVTHTDGFAVQEREADAFYIGMGERYDVVVTLADGVFPLVATPIGKDGAALAVVRTGPGPIPTPARAAEIRELTGPVLLGSDLRPAAAARLPDKEIGQSVDLALSGRMSSYEWAINGAPYGKNEPIAIEPGKRVSVQMTNMTMMTHPMHLHGHTFALSNGLRKDTVLLTPMQRMVVELEADNPGNWAAHCHNIYHAEAGMMAALVYDNPS
ncbi:multicopper oxidase family protein [Nocardioides sp. NPDC023903]|uniref:multicopper oxidase family protein n=1 Tax=Nocardioides sp. NPDC023903 TaxID=3157195 RepID=UPI0033C99066